MLSGAEVFVAKLIGAPVFDPNAERVGKVRDVVLVFSNSSDSKAVGLVVEVAGGLKRSIFVSFGRVTSISTSANSPQVMITGLLNMRRFEKRATETLVKADILDRVVTLNNSEDKFSIDDISITSISARGKSSWVVSRLFVRRIEKNALGNLFKKKTETRFVKLSDTDLMKNNNNEQLTEKVVEELEDMKPADAADAILEMEDDRQAQVAKELDNETLADVLEEMPEDEQIQILSNLDTARVADVIEEMEPDDAADLLSKMDKEEAQEILDEMNEEEADDVRQLLAYDSFTAGGLMTTTPIILEPNATVAFALAQIRREELSPSLASLVFICFPPNDTPTGQFVGVVHFQQLLRYPPSSELKEIVDSDIRKLSPSDSLDVVARAFATYDAFMLPVVNSDDQLLGAISIDDLIDHMLPDNWRETKDEDAK